MVKVGAAPRESPPAIRLRRVPPLDPPYDDEVAPDAWATAFGAAQLPLDWTAAVDPAASQRWGDEADGRGRGEPHRPQRGAGTTGSRPGGATHPAPGAVAGASAEAKVAVRRFLGVCLEVLNGYRPAGQLRPLSAPGEATVIIEQLNAAVARVAQLRRDAGGPVGARIGGAELVRVRRLRVCEPRAGAAEATVILLTAGRTWALALRLERQHDRWTATAARLV